MPGANDCATRDVARRIQTCEALVWQASPLIAAQTVPFGSRFGGWILRGRPGVTLPALRVAIRLPGARSGQRVRQLPELLDASVRGHPAMRRCNLCLNSRIATCRQLYSIHVAASVL